MDYPKEVVGGFEDNFFKKNEWSLLYDCVVKLIAEKGESKASDIMYGYSCLYYPGSFFGERKTEANIKIFLNKTKMPKWDWDKNKFWEDWYKKEVVINDDILIYQMARKALREKIASGKLSAAAIGPEREALEDLRNNAYGVFESAKQFWQLQKRQAGFFQKTEKKTSYD